MKLFDLRTATDGAPKLQSSWINLLTVALGIAAAYFMTIQSLRMELAAKAESEVVITLDKKLANFEVILKECVVSKEEFFRFSKEVDAKLIRIEYYLTDQAGDEIGYQNKP